MAPDSLKFEPAPLYGAKYALIGYQNFMPHILACSVEAKAMFVCKELSGWGNDDTIKVFELKEVAPEKK